MSTKLRYLALGDSYTIGEGVPPEESFPLQTVARLHARGEAIDPPIIIAQTGWTTDELSEGIGKAAPSGPFDVVTLLIGVNNQYRERSLENYRLEFEALLEQAIEFAAGHPQRVTVLSIPDWGVSPFAEGRDTQRIADEIDAFNEIAQEICEAHQVTFINITEDTREWGRDPESFTADGLHLSGEVYEGWAKKLARHILEEADEPL